MSELDDEEIVDQRRVEEAQPLADEERLRTATRLVEALRAEGFDCELAEAEPVH